MRVNVKLVAIREEIFEALQLPKGTSLEVFQAMINTLAEGYSIKVPADPSHTTDKQAVFKILVDNAFDAGILGALTAEDARGTSDEDYDYAPKELALFKIDERRVMSGKTIARTYKDKDGLPASRVIKEPIRNKEGTVIGIKNQTFDLTDTPSTNKTNALVDDKQAMRKEIESVTAALNDSLCVIEESAFTEDLETGEIISSSIHFHPKEGTFYENGLGYTYGDIAGKRVIDFVTDDCKEFFRDCLDRRYLSGIEVFMRKANGESIPCSINVKINEVEGKVHYGITDQSETGLDKATRLPGKELFAAVLLRDLNRLKRTKTAKKKGAESTPVPTTNPSETTVKAPPQSIALLMIDMNSFSFLNDNYGELFADNCIIKVSKVLRKAFRAYDFISRANGSRGDEFLGIVYDYETIANLQEILDRVVQKVAINKLSLSIGVIPLTPDKLPRKITPTYIKRRLNEVDELMQQTKTKVKEAPFPKEFLTKTLRHPSGYALSTEPETVRVYDFTSKKMTFLSLSNQEPH